MYTALIMLLFVIPWWLTMLTTLSMLISHMEILFCVMSVQARCLSFYVRFQNFVFVAFIYIYVHVYIYIYIYEYQSFLLKVNLRCVHSNYLMWNKEGLETTKYKLQLGNSHTKKYFYSTFVSFCNYVGVFRTMKEWHRLQITKKIYTVRQVQQENVLPHPQYCSLSGTCKHVKTFSHNA